MAGIDNREGACRRRLGFLWRAHTWNVAARDGTAFVYEECFDCGKRRILHRPGGRFYPMQFTWLDGGRFEWERASRVCPSCDADVTAIVHRVTYKTGRWGLAGRRRIACKVPVVVTCPQGHVAEYEPVFDA